MAGTDDPLLASARAGDAGAVERLVAEYRPRVFRYCLARLRSADLADDVTQEVCVALVGALPRYEDRGSPFAAFVFGIAARQVALARRTAARRREDPVGEVPDAADPRDAAEALVQQMAALDRVSQLLDQLPEQHREVLVLRVVAGLSAEETAVALGTTAGAVRVTQHRALNRLRQIAAADAAEESA